MDFHDDNANNADIAVAADDDESSSDERAETEDVRRVCLFAGVVRSNKDYGLSNHMVLPDPEAAALAMFEALELQAPTFFASCSVVCASRFTEVDPPVCFKCLCWDLTAQFMQCNHDG
jgi:hypothetical protein